MSGALRTSILALRAGQPKGQAVPNAPPHTARALGLLERRYPNSGPAGRGDPEGDRAFLGRVATQPVMALSANEARRALRPAWVELKPTAAQQSPIEPKVSAGWVRTLTERLVNMNWKPADRRLVLVWLDVFPRNPDAAFLAQAARVAAGRHEWPIREAGDRLNLWDPVAGPRALARAFKAKIVEGEDPTQVLDQAGLSSLPDAGIVEAALDRLADETAAVSPVAATREVTALLDLLDQLPGQADRQLSPALVHGLLAPWLEKAPSSELKARLQTLLLARVGDPRFKGAARWAALTREMVARGYPKADRIEPMLRYWLIGEAFELFFKLLADTTVNPAQWQRRQKFWRRYLDAGRISNAWFVLGSDAAHWAKTQGDRLKRGQYGQLSAGANAQQSALLLQIGELTIAEWSDNGSCCFWRPGATEMPQFGAPWLNGKYLRASGVMEEVAARDFKRTGKWLWQAIGHRGRDWETQFDNAIAGRW